MQLLTPNTLLSFGSPVGCAYTWRYAWRSHWRL